MKSAICTTHFSGQNDPVGALYQLLPKLNLPARMALVEEVAGKVRFYVESLMFILNLCDLRNIFCKSFAWSFMAILKPYVKCDLQALKQSHFCQEALAFEEYKRRLASVHGISAASVVKISAKFPSAAALCQASST